MVTIALDVHGKKPAVCWKISNRESPVKGFLRRVTAPKRRRRSRSGFVPSLTGPLSE
jgi:hypothetical protein